MSPEAAMLVWTVPIAAILWLVVWWAEQEGNDFLTIVGTVFAMAFTIPSAILMIPT